VETGAWRPRFLAQPLGPWFDGAMGEADGKVVLNGVELEMGGLNPYVICSRVGNG